ncbi:MAG: hypothetical protein HY066_00330 [Betaproteobacteria bacterium]|nr:hypothetical protein [Betaproteobacteria bacterium]
MPYQELGLPDLRDADGNCLWYAVSGTFKNNIKATSSVMNWDTQGQFSIVGTTVAPDQGDGGAAAVIFSPGVPLASQTRSQFPQPCNADPSQVSAYLDGNYNFATSATIQITPGVVKDSLGNIINNDRLMTWITPKEIFDKVIKRQDFSNPASASPAGQINYLTDEIRGALEKNIQDDLTNGTTTSQPIITGYSPQISGKLIGNLPAALTLYHTAYSNYYNNWSEQYRQIMCSSLTSPCLTVAGTPSCRGALMFAGRSANGQPRPSAQKTAGFANLANYFESIPGGGLDILNSAANTFPLTGSGSTAYSAANPSADVGVCLFPGAFVSLAQDFAAFNTGTVSSTGSGSPVASVNTSTPAINLGSTTLASRSGCVWFPTPISLGSMLRLYFKFRINTGSTGSGPGFTLALADASTNNVANTNPIMCGAASSTRLGYAGTPPSGSSAGIKPPKLGVEFDTSINSSRNDPSSDHFAFLYWGMAGDNSPTGTNTGDDDNTHYKGILGSGSEPLNPGPLSLTTATATPIATLAAATWSSGTVTATSAAPHGFATGQEVLISDTAAAGYSPGASPVPVTVTDATHFTYTLGSAPGAYTYGATASRSAITSSAAWSSTGGGTVTVTTQSNHGFSAGQFVNISGISPAGYNGTYQIVSIIDPQNFTYSLATNPGSYSADGYATATNKIVSATWAPATPSGIVTVTTATNHGLSTGEMMNIAGISPAGYNGSFPVTVIDSTHFTYPLTVDPGAGFTGGVFALPGIATVKSPYFPAGGLMPLASDIHVRLDISRTYDAMTKRATLTLKAYVDNQFPLADACSYTDFQNLTRDLPVFCPSRAPTIEQDNIVINDVNGPALASIYVGFTTARGSGSSDNQDISISNLLMRSQ